jgi:hypothetical protein
VYRPANPPMDFSRILSTVGMNQMMVVFSRACKPMLCNERQDAWPAELMGEPKRGVTVQTGNGARRTGRAAGVRYLHHRDGY